MKKKKIETVNITPTWGAVLSLYLALLAGDRRAKLAARKLRTDLARLGPGFDRHSKTLHSTRATKAEKSLAVFHLKRLVEYQDEINSGKGAT